MCVSRSSIGPGTDTREEVGPSGGAERTQEPRSQDTAGGGRRAGLGLSTVIGLLLVAVPIVWGAIYIAQAGAAGLGSGFTILVGVVVLAAVGAGAALLAGLFRT